MLKTDRRPVTRPPIPTKPPPFPKTELHEQGNTVPGLLASAFWWLGLSVALVPLQPRSKHKVKGYGAHQQQVITPQAARIWWGNRSANLGVVLGSLPGLVCLDFDDLEVFQAWRDGPGAEVSTRIELTPRPGIHVFFVTTRPPVGHPIKGLEVKTSGVIVAAPSVGENGAPYSVLSPGPITSLRSSYLTPAFFSFSQSPTLARPAPRARAPRGKSLIADIKQARPIADELAILLPGLVVHGPGQFKRGCCPFHHDEHASFWVNVESNLWGCLAASCPYSESNSGKRAFDVIDLYAAVHRLEVKEAVRSMAREEGFWASPGP